MEFLVENVEQVLAALGALSVLATTIVKLTPTPADDHLLARLVALFSLYSRKGGWTK